LRNLLFILVGFVNHQRNREIWLMSDFNIQKWYMDCTDDGGTAFIGYMAQLQWKSFHLTYSSILDFDGSKPDYRTSLSAAGPPVTFGDRITWHSTALSCRGEWLHGGKPMERQTLYHSNDGDVNWQVLCPLAQVRIARSGQGADRCGMGYLEKLEMSLPPWQLPIDTLIWGRFVAPELGIVWLKWTGDHPLESVYINGCPAARPNVTAQGVSWTGGALRHLAGSVLREGPLIKTALKKIPGLKSVFPAKILNLNEVKWFCADEAAIGDRKYSGWSIHEQVQF
jgi:hypothetical protein